MNAKGKKGNWLVYILKELRYKLSYMRLNIVAGAM